MLWLAYENFIKTKSRPSFETELENGRLKMLCSAAPKGNKMERRKSNNPHTFAVGKPPSVIKVDVIVSYRTTGRTNKKTKRKTKQ